MSESKSVNASPRVGLVPFAIAFPLLVIAFEGCLGDGCQGALNAQSTAVHEAYVVGGWGN